MNPLELLNAHRSIRAYAPDPIPEDVLQSILHAATRASSSGNMQTYSILVTRDAERRRALWKYHFEQDMVVQAPVLLTFVADWNRMNRWCRRSDAEPGFDNFLSFLVAFADAMIAAQNAALAAESHGLGICYMGTTLCATTDLIEFFGLPADTFPATTLVVGTPREDPELRARLPLESIVHQERYQPYDDERIRRTYESRETEGWKRYMSFPDLAAKMTSSGVKNLAQVYTQLKYTQADNEEISTELLENLRRAGFLS
ncbi:MAG: NADPH-dependent oxidoreductase [Gemmatimonadota bacterium]|nr:MAG: NADPH-dependent oxidoreductase [Gemmatimonadota bacterium]